MPTRIEGMPWGVLTDGQAIRRYTLVNAPGARVSLMSLGAAILSIEVPDRNGELGDVVLGYSSAADYLVDNFPYFGLTIGRYANRIAGSALHIAGKSYALAAPAEAPGRPARMVLHGGAEGFDKRVWTADRVTTDEGLGLRFTLVSPDGDQGFPGELTASITYHWTDEYCLIATYAATTTRPTVVNLTQHSYFNLAGAGSGDILDHSLKINADFITEATRDNLPTGEIRSVSGTPFDFRLAKPIGRDLQSDHPNIRANRGYDQNFVLRRAPVRGELVEAAVLADPVSGRILTVATTEPGLVVYTANRIDTRRKMKAGLKYRQWAGVALETGHFPDSPNQPHFPRTTLLPGETLQSRTVFAFTAR